MPKKHFTFRLLASLAVALLIFNIGLGLYNRFQEEVDIASANQGTITDLQTFQSTQSYFDNDSFNDKTITNIEFLNEGPFYGGEILIGGSSTTTYSKNLIGTGNGFLALCYPSRSSEVCPSSQFISLPSSVDDIDVDTARGEIVIVGAFGVAKLDSNLNLLWHKTRGDIGNIDRVPNYSSGRRVSIAPDGSVAALFNKNNQALVFAYNTDGSTKGSNPITYDTGHDNPRYEDILIDSTNSQVLIAAWSQSAPNLQTPLLIALSINSGNYGNLNYQAFRYWGSKATEENLTADTRIYRLERGEDSSFYFAGYVHGGNNRFNKNHLNPTESGYGNQTNNLSIDSFSNMTGGQQSGFSGSYIARFVPTSGEVLKGQFFHNREGNSNSNKTTFTAKALTADQDGNILFGGFGAGNFPCNGNNYQDYPSLCQGQRTKLQGRDAPDGGSGMVELAPDFSARNRVTTTGSEVIDIDTIGDKSVVLTQGNVQFFTNPVVCTTGIPPGCTDPRVGIANLSTSGSSFIQWTDSTDSTELQSSLKITGINLITLPNTGGTTVTISGSGFNSLNSTDFDDLVRFISSSEIDPTTGILNDGVSIEAGCKNLQIISDTQLTCTTTATKEIKSTPTPCTISPVSGMFSVVLGFSGGTNFEGISSSNATDRILDDEVEFTGQNGPEQCGIEPISEEIFFIPNSDLTFQPARNISDRPLKGTQDITLTFKSSNPAVSEGAQCRIRARVEGSNSWIILSQSGASEFVIYTQANGCSSVLTSTMQGENHLWEFEIYVINPESQNSNSGLVFGTTQSYYMKFGAFAVVSISSELL